MPEPEWSAPPHRRGSYPLRFSYELNSGYSERLWRAMCFDLIASARGFRFWVVLDLFVLLAGASSIVVFGFRAFVIAIAPMLIALYGLLYRPLRLVLATRPEFNFASRSGKKYETAFGGQRFRIRYPGGRVETWQYSQFTGVRHRLGFAILNERNASDKLLLPLQVLPGESVDWLREHIVRASDGPMPTDQAFRLPDER